MDRPFPFCYPAPTAFYLIAYMASLLVHLVFMQYVLAGSAYLVFGRFLNRAISFRRNQKTAPNVTDEAPDPIHETLRDWLPFATSAAITAGVAPLLFLQILYRKSFYTANLLLFHRWMAIVPVLIVGFYLLYLLKTERLRRGPPWKESAVALAALACFGFTAWSWTENHLLSLDWKNWSEVYRRGELMHHTSGAYWRTVGWILMSFPTMLLLVAWQIHSRQSTHFALPDLPTKTIAGLSNLMLVFGPSWIVLSVVTGPAPTSPVTQRDLDTYGLLFVGALIVSLLAWMFQSRHAQLRRRLLMIASAGQFLLLIAIVALRELGRMAKIDMKELTHSHADAFRIAGLPLFLLFFLVNAVLVAWCIRIARRARISANAP